MKTRGFALVAVILLIALLALIAGSVGSYIAGSVQAGVQGLSDEKALYAAEAGIMRGIVDYDVYGRSVSVRNASLIADTYYHVDVYNADAMSASFTVDPSNSEPNPADRHSIWRVGIRNSGAAPIVITNMVLTWNANVALNSITLGNVEQWSGSLTSPANLAFGTPFTIPAGTNYNANGAQQFEFSGNINGNVTATCFFSDASMYRSTILRNGGNVNPSQQGIITTVPVKATGEVRSDESVVRARRTIVASFSASANRFYSWNETTEHIIP